MSGGGWYVSGKKATLKSSPTSAAWRFVNWTDNEGTVVSTQSTFTYSDINANKTLTANYERQQVSRVTLSHDPSTGNFKATLSGAGTYAVGAKIRVRANNVSDWTLVNWTRKDNGEVMSTTNEFDYVTTEEDVEFVAHYRFTPGSSPAEPNETKAKHKVDTQGQPVPRRLGEQLHSFLGEGRRAVLDKCLEQDRLEVRRLDSGRRHPSLYHFVYRTEDGYKRYGDYSQF